MPLVDQWQGYTGLPDFPDPGTIPTDFKNLFDFLASRAVPRYANIAARDAELASPVNGMMCWVTAENTVYVRQGGAWRVLWSGGNDTGWLTITPGAGFTAATAAPQARRIGNVVYLRGQMSKSSGNVAVSDVLGSLPAGFAPARQMTPVFVGSGADYAKGTVNTDLSIAVVGISGNTTYLRFDTVSYVLG